MACAISLARRREQQHAHKPEPDGGLDDQSKRQFHGLHRLYPVVRDAMHILFLGDIVGKPGRDAMAAQLPGLRARLKLDLVIANGENAAGGFGLTRAIAQDFFAWGVDVITTGNHWADQKEIFTLIEEEDRIVRPCNYPPGTPGRGATMAATAAGAHVLVVNAMGRVFMDALDDPFAAVGRELEACPLGAGADAIVVDMHAEATSEKMAMGHFCDGRASLVVGSHSHVPTADAQILPGGTAFQADAGACADYDSVIGMDKAEPLHRFTRKLSTQRYSPATGPATLCGVYVETGANGFAARIEPVRVGGRLKATMPEL
jgi:metallophosphoesterase (TIGR00282 family)